MPSWRDVLRRLAASLFYGNVTNTRSFRGNVSTLSEDIGAGDHRRLVLGDDWGKMFLSIRGVLGCKWLCSESTGIKGVSLYGACVNALHSVPVPAMETNCRGYLTKEPPSCFSLDNAVYKAKKEQDNYTYHENQDGRHCIMESLQVH